MRLVSLRQAGQILILLGASLLLAGCLSVPDLTWLRDQIPFLPSTADNDLVEIEVWVPPGDDAQRAHIQAIVDEFLAIQPSVRITLTQTEDHYAQLDRLLTQDDLPNIFLLDGFRFPRFHAEDALAPIPQPVDEDFLPLLREAFSRDGRLYCMPNEFRTLALIYNKNLFDAVGLDYPDAGWTWTDLRAAAEAISELPTVHFTPIGFALSADATRWLPFLHQTGGSWANVDQGGQTPGAAPLQEALAYYLSFFADGLAAEPADLESSWNGELFATERVGMTVEGNWIVPYLENELPGLEFGVAPLPAGPRGAATVAFADCYAVAASSPNQDVAFQLAAALTSVEAMSRAPDSTGAAPARQSVLGPWTTQHPRLAPFVDGLDHTFVWQFAPELEEIPAAVNEALRSLIDGDWSVNDAVENLRSTSAEMLTE